MKRSGPLQHHDPLKRIIPSNNKTTTTRLSKPTIRKSSSTLSVRTSILLMIIILSAFSWFVMIGSQTDAVLQWQKIKSEHQQDAPSQQHTQIRLKGGTVHRPQSIEHVAVPKHVKHPVQSRHTVVTAYFQVKSKFDSSNYDGWMQNMLSLTDPMIIFTSPSLISQMERMRHKAPNNATWIIPIPNPLNETLPIAQVPYDWDFWQKQWSIDPERRIHRSIELFWIWLSKSWFVTQAMDANPFQSDIFVWSDIGCFRNKKYNEKQMVQHYDMIPKTSVLQMAHHDTIPPKYVWWNNKYDEKINFYHSGSQMAAYDKTWTKYHHAIQETIEGFVKRNMFIGEDQTVLQSTCLRIPTLCQYVPTKQVRDNHYFGLRYVLHHGGNYTYWSPPEGLPLEKKDVDEK